MDLCGTGVSPVEDHGQHAHATAKLVALPGAPLKRGSGGRGTSATGARFPDRTDPNLCAAIMQPRPPSEIV